MHISGGFVLFALTFALSQPLLAQDRGTFLVLDGSGSMWAQLPEGRSRIEVARDILSDFLTARDPAQPLGVIAYGHNRRSDCADIETIVPMNVQDGRALGQRLRGLMPRGKTPLADALRRAMAEIPTTTEQVDIVLITDGLETCGGDPCAVAAEMAAAGVPIRAHVVGFGLSEGEVRQIACIAEQTGGTVLAPQSGTELADALVRTAAPVLRDAAEPDRAALDVTLDTDAAGRPDAVDFVAENLDTGEALALGRLDFSAAWTLPVELPKGRWRLSADAGEAGQGSLDITIKAGENRTVYVPFTGIMPSISLDQIGPYRAGATAVFPLRINREGLATGGADFQMTLLPMDATALDDRPLNWSANDGSLGAYLPYLPLPADPAQYKVAWHRYGETDLGRALAVLDIVAEARPDVTLAAPAVVAPGAAVPVEVRGGAAHADRVEIWKEGALYGWDQSLYLRDLFDNEYGPAKVLTAPAEDGLYEIVYLFSDIDGEAAIAARLPLQVGEVTVGAEEGAAVEPAQSTPDGSTEPAQDDAVPPEYTGYSCPSDHGVPCIFEDTATGLVFGLPPGWVSDMPTREAATAGDTGGNGPVRLSFFTTASEPESITLNPHQWVAMNGPCLQVQAGQLCYFDTGTAELERGLDVLTRALRDTRPAPRSTSTSANEALQQAMANLAAEAPAAAAAMGGLLAAASDGHDPDLTPDGTEAGRSWSSYPYRCLGQDRPNDTCSFRDPASGLFFELPEGWVAEVHQGTPYPHADFFDTGTGAGYIALNPSDWPNAPAGCAPTRAGMLCFDPDTADANLGLAHTALRQSLTTGEVLKQCEDSDCTFTQEFPAFAGRLPAFWGVEVAKAAADGTISTWFFDVDGGGDLKLLALGQSEGADCLPTRFGPLCDMTGYISSQELELIAGALR